MGTFRLTLAFIVVIAHTVHAGTLPIIDGNTAVRLFFIVSGFYMAFILTDKYRIHEKTQFSLFYSNRALRIFPLLWLTLGIELAAAFLVSGLSADEWAPWIGRMGNLIHAGRYDLIGIYAVTQILAIGTDVMHLFTVMGEGQIKLYDGPIALPGWRGWQAYPMSHVWSISCELMFYTLAPFLNRLRTPILWIGIIIPSLLAPFFLKKFFGAPWVTVADSFVAPLQFGFFCLGIVSFRWYKSRLFKPQQSALNYVIVAALCTCIIFHNHFVAHSYMGSRVILLGLAFLALPILFGTTLHLKIDRMLGSLSYPVYLVHITVIRLLDLPSIRHHFGAEFFGSIYHSLLVMTLACSAAWLLVHCFDEKIDSWRQSRMT